MQEESSYLVYILIFPDNKGYVGMTMMEEQHIYKGRCLSQRMKLTISEYGGMDAVKCLIRKEQYTKYEASVEVREQIELLHYDNPKLGYNYVDTVLRCKSPETCHKISEGNMGKRSGQRHTAETKEKMRKSHIGLEKEKHTEEAKKRMSQARKEYWERKRNGL